MKKYRFALIFLITVTVLGVAVFPSTHTATAQEKTGICRVGDASKGENVTNQNNFSRQGCINYGNQIGRKVEFYPRGTEVPPEIKGNQTPAAEAKAIDDAIRGNNNSGCGGLIAAVTDPVGETKCALMQVASAILFIPLGLTSLVLGLSGTLLNAVLNFSVINLTANISAITGIPTAWGFLRDISNMVFIFVLIYIAIKTILGLGDNKMKQTLVAVVIAALLINFSLFFTKVMIDASNLLALTFYEKAVPNATAGNLLTTGLANSFMQPLKLSSFYDVGQDTSLLTSLGDLGKIAAVSMLGSVFFIVLTFVFLAVSVMFLIRYVNIIFLLILSPVAFLGSVLPGFGKRVRDWWTKSLSGNLVFAPIYMILTFAVLSVINSDGFLNNSLTAGGSAGGVASSFSAIVQSPAGVNKDAFGLIMNFIVVIVLAIGTLIISKTVADQGGSIGSKLVGGALGAGAATAAFGGRRIIGGGARMAANSKDLRERAANVDGKYSRINQMRAQAMLKVAQRGAGASFDVRGSKALGAVGGAIGFDATKEFGLGKAGGKGGYDAVIKEQIKKKDEFAKSLGPTEIEKDRAKQELTEAKKSGDKERMRTAQAKVDEIEGVSEKEAKTRADKLEEEKEKELKNNPVLTKEKELEEEIAKKKKDIINELDPQIREAGEKELQALEKDLQTAKTEADTTRKEIESDYTERKSRIKEIDGLGKRRAAAYAKHITEPASMNVFGWNIPLPSTSRAGFIGPVSYSNKMAAAKIRGGKSTKDSLVEMAKKLAKEEGEEDVDKEKDKGEDKKDDKDKGADSSGGASSPKT